MKFRRLQDIWAAEKWYEEFRWSEEPTETLSDEVISNLRNTVADMLEALAPWLSRIMLAPHNRLRIHRFKRKLIEYQWQLIYEGQRRERVQAHNERIMNMLEPQELDEGLPTPNFGLKGPLKGSDSYKNIPRDLLAPIPREGALP